MITDLDLSYTSPEVRFVEEGHRYYWRRKDAAEEQWISVTQALELCGLTDGYEGIPWPVIERAGRRGTAVHKALPLLLNDDLDWQSVDSRIIGYVEQMARALEEMRFKPWNVETPVASERLRCMGTPDAWGLAYGEPTIPDFKTGARSKIGLRNVGHQTNLYALMVSDRIREQRGEERTPKRLAIWLQPDSFRIDPLPNSIDGELNAEAIVRVAWLRHIQTKGETK